MIEHFHNGCIFSMLGNRVLRTCTWPGGGVKIMTCSDTYSHQQTVYLYQIMTPCFALKMLHMCCCGARCSPWEATTNSIDIASYKESHCQDKTLVKPLWKIFSKLHPWHLYNERPSGCQMLTGVVSLYLTSFPYEFSWDCQFANGVILWRICSPICSSYIAVIFPWKTTHSSPVRCRPWLQIWPKWYQFNCCSVFNIVIIAIYRESIVYFALEIGSSVHRWCCRCIISVTKYNVLWGVLFASAKMISHEECLGSRPKCSKASP